ncbi:hypothetical protein CHS0354_025301 [Potamilus streckersoni]|uniref:TIR domain-containing protein n=1 Tax=Potamilus streckersoni TaxID=2493646 RepID=A0AAE0RUS2_9BIVA|nr:hypothetical protein CHS0354_025301 [Potamilus streckersoni]
MAEEDITWWKKMFGAVVQAVAVPLAFIEENGATDSNKSAEDMAWKNIILRGTDVIAAAVLLVALMVFKTKERCCFKHAENAILNTIIFGAMILVNPSFKETRAVLAVQEVFSSLKETGEKFFNISEDDKFWIKMTLKGISVCLMAALVVMKQFADKEAGFKRIIDDHTEQEREGLPPEILRMDTRSQELYRQALEAGKVKVYNIRLMIVGHLGVGKTTLTKRLLDEDAVEAPHVSTKGIAVHSRCCKIDLDTKEWIVEGKENRFPDNGHLLIHIVSEHVANESILSKDDVNQEEMNRTQTLLTNTEQDLKDGFEQKGRDNCSFDGAIPVYLEPMRTDTNSTREKDYLYVREEQSMKEKQNSLDSNIYQNSQTDSNETISKGGKLDKKKSTGIDNTRIQSDFHDFVSKYGTLTYLKKIFCDVTLLDFAGQFVFYTTHQTFMSWRTIYLLVTDMSKSLEDLVKEDKHSLNLNRNMESSITDYAVFWLNSIHSHGMSMCKGSTRRETDNDEQNLIRGTKYPPVILVATHSDKVPECGMSKTKNEYFDGVRRVLKERPQRFLLRGYFAISNFGPDTDIDALKQKIFALAQEQDYWGEEIPARWIILEQKLMELKKSGVKIIEHSLVEKINNSSDVKIESKEELDVFLRFEHDLGSIVFFSTEKLRDKIVLDPDWLIDGVRVLISPPLHVLDENPEIHPQWYDFMDTGRLTKTLVGRLWSDDKHEDFHRNRDYLLDLMEKLSIIAKPAEKDFGEKDQKGFYWVPCVIYKSAPDHVKNLEPHDGMTRTSTLCFVSKTKFIHVGVFHRLVASFLSKWPPAEDNGEFHVYNGCCEFEVDNRHSLLLVLNDYAIFATMFRSSSGGDFPDNGLCRNIRNLISSTLTDITACISPNSEFDVCVKCERSSTDTIKGLLAISDRDEIRCKCSKPVHPVKVENLLKFWEIDPADEYSTYSGTSDLTIPNERQVSLWRRTLTTGKKYHVFFSYSSSDIQWVKKTVDTLEKEYGYFCCEYDRDNTPGTSLLKFASDSIKHACKTIVVMTREAFESGFVSYETEMAIMQGFLEKRKCVVPILLKDCEVPSHLSVLNYIDARDPRRRDIWWPKLLTELENQGERCLASTENR